jgi:hypothetical protein
MTPSPTIREVLDWMEERSRNSRSYGSHADAYEIAARKLREAMGLKPLPEDGSQHLSTVGEVARAKPEDTTEPNPALLSALVPTSSGGVSEGEG